MAGPIDHEAELKVGAHVLVQLGSELVTDVEQAILECVKNAYDADAPGCKIDIDTRETGYKLEDGTVDKYWGFDSPTETVTVEILGKDGQPLAARPDAGDIEITRRLNYTGRITIEDKGDGIDAAQLRSSWLVISRSNKRSAAGGQKNKTKKGRTPLGDKGLGRLGSMKLGDILRIETATSATGQLAVAEFRWADCEDARTVDQIPVFVDSLPNDARFKGTRVSVLGLRDLPEWRRKDRIAEITRSLARLISPFEATSTFPVGITLDGNDQSLVSVTDELLKRAVAEFIFEWKDDEADSSKRVLVATARFRKSLFTSERSRKNRERTAAVFSQDRGAGFAESLKSYGRLKPYREKAIDLDGAWFVELKRTFQWSDMQLDTGAALVDPGPFSGAFYFFHLDKLGPEEGDIADVDAPAAAGIGIDRQLLKDMTGISILRDGFRVRSQGDWLGLSQSMTSGSTYGMRVDNTVGYFALTGECNYKLVEKSDREGFVEDAAYRGFMQVAKYCRGFANESLEQVRRALDDYYKRLLISEEGMRKDGPPASAFEALESGIKSTEHARDDAERIAAELQADLDRLEREAAAGITNSEAAGKALNVANRAVAAMQSVQIKLTAGARAGANLVRLRQEFDEKDEQTIALFESAAVGLSARGLAHELRTHLTEIRQRSSAIDQIAKAGASEILPHLRAIRASCTAISSAAALIDPMLPRSRSVKETIVLRAFVEDFFKARSSIYERAGINVRITGTGATVRANRPRLTQVFDNLVRNSAYWLRRGEMTSQVKRPKEISVELTAGGFIISDSGPGVDPDYESSLFEIFVTAKPERDTGQGLGLFIVTELLRADGCEISLLPERNADGRLYRFSVNLRPLVLRP
ncbi:sensor histidine kinase [Shinella sp. 838]|uniref:sensor histidine kinase n=1 Tax=Shinella sp. 838 TaxID=3038164 RepID=UPI0024154BB6|nr:sensor histidine kinase [Shinella sp. 838]MDG4670984.1 sensor histidine kinase [Shinella sp. 838]